MSGSECVLAREVAIMNSMTKMGVMQLVPLVLLYGHPQYSDGDDIFATVIVFL